MVSELGDHRWCVSFDGAPDHGRFWAATPAALVGLKADAFGRTRPSGEPVDRDFSDVALLLDKLGDEIANEARPGSQMHSRVVGAARRLAGDDAAVAAAAREFVHGGREETQLAAETEVRRIARNALRRIAAD